MNNDGGTTKTTVRLKHSLPEGTEIEVVLPGSLAEVEAMFGEGDERD